MANNKMSPQEAVDDFNKICLLERDNFDLSKAAYIGLEEGGLYFGKNSESICLTKKEFEAAWQWYTAKQELSGSR
jgi:hypothetical protein